MLSLKEKIGNSSGITRAEVTQKQINEFCKAIGTKERAVAPPTFLTTFRRAEFDLFKTLGIELASVLHAEQEYQFENPLKAGDKLSFETTLSNVLEKQGSTSSMQFLTFVTEFHGERGGKALPIGKSKTTIVVRSKKENNNAGTRN